jgi:hypothetical protein
MTDEEREKLLDHPMFKVANNAGYDWPVGWDGIIKELVEGIKSYLCEGLGLKVIQVKEKTAGLRFYYDFVAEGELPEEKQVLRDAAIEHIKKLIGKAESDSYHTCEECGSPDGKGCSTSKWMVTACEPCAKKNEWIIYDR